VFCLRRSIRISISAESVLGISGPLAISGYSLRVR
jgi:hypothetical protein